MAVTTSMRFWNEYNEFDWRLCLFPEFGASIVFIIGSSVSVMRFTCILVVLCLVALSFFPFRCQAMDRHSSSVSTAPSLDDDFKHNIWNPVLNLLFLEQVSGNFASFVVVKLTWPISHCLVTLLLIYYVTRRSV